MEIIPILSTIILAATAVTFLLALGAYILYKIREHRGKKRIINSPLKYEAELLSPVKNEKERIPEDLKLQPYDYNKMKRNLNNIPLQDIDEKKDDADIVKELKDPKKNKSKFLKYTPEGYISPKEDKKQGFNRWR